MLLVYLSFCIDKREAETPVKSSFEEMAKRAIKAEILKKLGMSSAPNITGKFRSNLSVALRQKKEVFQSDYIPGYDLYVRVVS